MFLKRLVPKEWRWAKKNNAMPVWPRSGYPTETLRRGVGISGSLGGAGAYLHVFGTLFKWRLIGQVRVLALLSGAAAPVSAETVSY